MRHLISGTQLPGYDASYRWKMRRPYRRVSYRRRQGGTREAPVLRWDGSERFLNPGGRPRLEACWILQDERIKICKETESGTSETPPFQESPRPGNYRSRGHRRLDIRITKEMHNLYLGCRIGGNDHRPLESVSEALPVRDLLLWAEKLFPLRQGQRARCPAEKACLTPKKTGSTRTRLAP